MLFTVLENTLRSTLETIDPRSDSHSCTHFRVISSSDGPRAQPVHSSFLSWCGETPPKLSVLEEPTNDSYGILVLSGTA